MTPGAFPVEPSDNHNHAAADENCGACCRATSQAHTIDEDDDGRWLTKAARILAELAPPGSVAWCAAKRSPDQSGAADTWTFLGVCGFADAAQSPIHPATPPAKFAGKAVAKQLTMHDAQGVYIASADESVCPPGPGAQLKGCRVLAWCPVPDAETSTRFVVEIVGLDPSWRPSARQAEVIGCAVQGVAAAFSHHILKSRERHERLLSAVGPSARAILPMLAEGKSEREIAKQIYRSVHTVHDYVKQVYRALGVSSRLELHDAWIGLRSFDPVARRESKTAQP